MKKSSLMKIVIVMFVAMISAPNLFADTCYPELPDPSLIFTGTYDYVGADGNDYTRYELAIENWLDFPDEIFTAAPDLPPCGLNTNSSRSWVGIYAVDGSKIYGYCAISSASGLYSISFGWPMGETPPPLVYIEIVDRLCEITYTSNLVSTGCACDDDWKNHGKFVSCVAKTTEDLVDDGLISEEEKDETVAAAAQSDCGK
jgi:hypothetical protein